MHTMSPAFRRLTVTPNLYSTRAQVIEESDYHFSLSTSSEFNNGFLGTHKLWADSCPLDL